MKLLTLIIGLTFSAVVAAGIQLQKTTVVNIPYMARPSLHRVYADALLALALDASQDKFGPYIIHQQSQETLITHQLNELAANKLSVAVAMPNKEWLQAALPVRFPMMKGLASYRLFFINRANQPVLAAVKSLKDLKSLTVGQGVGWSTASLLEYHGFKVVYAPDYNSLFPMLAADKYQLLMRGVYEMEVELYANKITFPALVVAENIAVYTYLPMYFFVSRSQPELAKRLEYGLKKLHASGQFDKLFMEHFWSALQLLSIKNRAVFSLPNSNINPSYFEHDKPYLLDFIAQ